MKSRRVEIDRLVRRAGELALALRDRSLEYVLCHTDIHAGNLLIAENPPGAHADKAHNGIYVVDWDNPLLAPKEHDLMFIGAGVGGGWDSPGIQVLFYQGYGETQVDHMALAYYRIERIVQDIAAFCEQLFLTTEGGEDREQSYRYFTGQFIPNHEVDIAWNTDKSSHADR
jgi:spectinomycin phosphotransferase